MEQEDKVELEILSQKSVKGLPVYGNLMLGVSVKDTSKIDYGVGRVLFAGEIAGFLSTMGEEISAGMESGYCAAQAIVQHFDDLKMLYSDYREKAKPLHSYMKRQWNFVAG